MALGLRFGRSRPEDEAAREREQAVAQAFTSRFRERCGATSCRALLGRDVTDPEELTKIKAGDCFTPGVPSLWMPRSSW